MGLADFILVCLIVVGIVSLVVGLPVFMLGDAPELYEYMKTGLGSGKLYDVAVSGLDIFKTSGNVFLRAGDWGAFGTAVLTWAKAVVDMVVWAVGTFVVVVVDMVNGLKVVGGAI